MQPTCPTCDATIAIAKDTQVSEILTCGECQSRVVVKTLTPTVEIVIAPIIEEDWGE